MLFFPSEDTLLNPGLLELLIMTLIGVLQVLTWAKQHEQRLEAALAELLNNAALLEELLSWLQWAETTLVQRDTEPLLQDIPQLKTLITEHQVDRSSAFLNIYLPVLYTHKKINITLI